MLLLFVDDNVEQHYLYKMYCTMLPNVTLARADNGAAGFALAQSLLPQLIVSDFDMPLMNGYSFWQCLRAEEKTCTIPFVLVSSYITPQGLFSHHHDEFEEIRRDPYACLHSKETFRLETLKEIVREAVQGMVVLEK